MTNAVAPAIFALLAVSLGEAKQPHVTFRLHAEANPRDGSVFSVQMRSSFSGKTVVLEKIPTISEHDVVAYQIYPAPNGAYGALLQLNEHGRLALDTLSIDRRGTLLYVFLNNRPVTELEIDRRVSDGKIYLASGLTAADIALMKKDWRLIAPRKSDGQ
jgi:hypothetical protein